MDNGQSLADFEKTFQEGIAKRPIPAAELLPVINSVTTLDSKKAEEWTLKLAQELTTAFDFAGLLLVIKDRKVQLGTAFGTSGIASMLKKAAIKDRLASAMIDAAAFGSVPLDNSLVRLDFLTSLKPGTLIIDPNWGIGEVKRLDDFYKRATIDFLTKRGHAMSFEALLDGVQLAPADHLLTRQYRDPEGIKKMAKEKPGELLHLILQSFGDMTIVKLENIVEKHNLVTPAGWKPFWEAARRDVKKDDLIKIPARRNDLIQLLTVSEDYGDAWFKKLSKTRNAEEILNAVLAFEATGKVPEMEDSQRSIIEERLAFAIKSAHNTNPPLYARLACAISRFGFLTPPLDDMRRHLMENNRYIKAAEHLAVHDTEALVQFLLAGGGNIAEVMLCAIPQMPYNILNDLLAALKDNPIAEKACKDLLKQPVAPATLVNWCFRNLETTPWKLPPLIDLLRHAISIIESHMVGEDLRMQNNIKLIFDVKGSWMDKFFNPLPECDRRRLFDRIQASPAWNPSTQSVLLKQMIEVDPDLAKLKRVTVKEEKQTLRITSWRSLAEKQLSYQHLLEVEMPKNRKDIAFARSYGDLRENFEYQVAKDKERELQQRQGELQHDLGQVKGTDFAGIPTDRVAAGTTVTLKLADGSQKEYVILGEWDRDEKLNIISNKARLATALDGHRVNETVQVPSADGEEDATITAIKPLSDAVHAWLKMIPTEWQPQM